MAPDPGNVPNQDAWLQSNEVSVDVTQLKDFADHIQDEVNKNFMVSYQKGIVPLMSESGMFGLGGLKEGKFFRAAHKQSVDAMSQMLADAMKGMMNLSGAARAISMEYLAGDAFAQATLDDINDVFTPVPEPLDPNAGSTGSGDPNTTNPSGSDVNMNAWESSSQYEQNQGYADNSGPAYLSTDPPADSNIGDGKVIAAGEDGEFTIPEDNELRGPAPRSESPGPQPSPAPGPAPTPTPSR